MSLRADLLALRSGDPARPGVDDPAVDARVAIVLVVAALCLTGAHFVPSLIADDVSELARMVEWAATQIAFYGIVPLAVWTLLLRRPASEIGLRLHGIGSHVSTYALLFLLAAPFVLLASTTAEFQARYPLPYTPAGSDPWPGLWLWWAMYAVQFAAVELFFRGFLVHGLAPRFGLLSIPVMVVPYTMIHFVKPPAEAVAAIVGGFVMGFLAYRSRSIWWGVALHCAVAALMDVSSLAQKGLLW